MTRRERASRERPSGRAVPREPKLATTRSGRLAKEPPLVQGSLQAKLARSSIRSAAVVCVLLAFAAYLASQHRMVFPYHDDYGGATLDFSSEGVPGVTGFSGRDFGVQHAIEFAANMYMHWGGRFLVTLLHSYAFKGGIELVRSIQVVVIIAIVMLSAWLATQRSVLSYAVTIPAILFLAIPLVVAARGMYWFAASIQSMWGVPVLLVVGVLWSQGRSRGYLTWPIALLLGLASLFNEMMAAASLSLAGVLLAEAWLARSPERQFARCIPMMIPAALGSASVVLAPGNFVRAAQERSKYASTQVLEIVGANVTKISDLIVRDASASAYLACWIAFLVAVALIVAQQRSVRHAALAIGLSAIGILAGFALPSPGPLVGLAVSSVVMLMCTRGAPGSSLAFAFLCAALASLVPLLASPTVNARNMMAFYLLMFVPITWALCRVAAAGPYHAIITACAIALLSIPSAANARAIYRGYAALYPYLEANDVALATASEAARRGEPPQTIVYYRLPGIQFANLMPYQRDFIERWVRRYYSLPDSVSFDYRPPGELPRSRVSTHFPF